MYVIIVIAAIGMLSIASCKRNKSNEPEVTGPAGFRIILSGTANPSTLYVPENPQPVSSLITITALNNDGTPVVGKDVIFQENGGYGYFNNYQVSYKTITNASGMATATYFVPASTGASATLMTYITVTLVDDGRLDSTVAQVQDTIPIKIVPYLEVGFEISGYIRTPAGNGVGDVTVRLEGQDGHTIGFGITQPPGGYKFYVESGWYGTITPEKDGYTFLPGSVTISSDLPVSRNMTDMDFIAMFAAGDTLAVDVSSWTVGPDGGTQAINVYNSTGDTGISYTVIPDSSWLHVNPMSGNTPGSFTITADQNDTTTARNGSITITATNSSASGISISVSQTAQDVDPLARLEADVSTINAPSGGSATTVNLYNPTTSDSIPYYVTISDQSWISVDAFQGSANDSRTITVGQNTSGATRSGTVTINPTVTGASLSPWTITVTQDTGPTLAVSDNTLSFAAAGGSQQITVTNPSTSDSLTIQLSNADTWITASPVTTTTPDTITITVNANGTGSDRTGVLVISDTGTSGATVNVTITQGT